MQLHLDNYKKEYSAHSGFMPYCITAGGVVYRQSAKKIEFLLLGRMSKNNPTYHLPKGTLRVGETLEACALREIAEEAGASVQLKTYLGGNHDVYDFGGTHYDKIRHYYAVEFLQDTGPMDNEHDFKIWCSYDDAISKLKLIPKQEGVFVERCNNYLAS